jgi:hypothetical protein
MYIWSLYGGISIYRVRRPSSYQWDANAKAHLQMGHLNLPTSFRIKISHVLVATSGRRTISRHLSAVFE